MRRRTPGPRPLPPPIDPDRPSSLRELAGQLGISYERARRLRKNGLQVKPDGTYDLSEARMFDAARRARTPGLETEGMVAWNNRLRKAKALQAERDLVRSLERVVDVDEVRRQWHARMVQIKNRLTDIGRELAPHLAHRGPQEVLAIMDQHILQILRDLANTVKT